MEEESRAHKVLVYLDNVKEHGLVRPKTIGEDAKNVGKVLYELKERGLAVAPGEGLWKITPEGTASQIEAKPMPKPMPEPITEPIPNRYRTDTELIPNR